MLDAEIQEGSATAAKYSLPRLITLLRALSPDKRPRLIRGDNAFGNEPVMRKLEAVNQPYLFKLRQTSGIKQLMKNQWGVSDRHIGST